MTVVLLLMLSLAQLADVRQAWDLGRTTDVKLIEKFNDGYLLATSDVVDTAEVLTEFRRAVLVVRDHARRGDYGFTPIDVANAIKPFEGQVTFVVQTRLNPLRVFVAPPHYELFVSTGRLSKPLAAKPLKRDGIYGLGKPDSPGTLVGVRLEATFARDELEAAQAPVLTLVDERANVLWQAPIDLSRFR